ncbi:DUF4362 domain-containing protein [Paenibacillus sp. HJL G12]|uniref:DUF4362 domain-containing protein n=1 Tax=Paenibacillus dendrobii TaxID=2691084 RepID=A0A7X3IIA5_9BACL|nr:DUF4362 domain-containing protein [Paenibacillus dendrobii]MWV44463.1 DUF4362 domain-containing protein [Paenibacillus dendrobii]
MKPIRVTILLGLLAMIFGCSVPQEASVNDGGPDKIAKPANTVLTAKGADVVDTHGMVEHLELLDAFTHDQTGSQRLIRYTIEGDPIYYDLTRADGKVELRVDTTEDKFGKGEVRTYPCVSLVREETKTFLRYALTGCEGDSEDMELLRIPFDVSQQDRFEFVLKYGPSLTNEINTVDYKLLKDLGNDQMVEVSDFSITEQDRQKVYRELVLAGYLNEKKLSSACKLENGDSYDLKVFINGGERHFQWRSCDTGADGKQMTAAVKKIIGIVQAGSIYQSLPKTEAEQHR